MNEYASGDNECKTESDDPQPRSNVHNLRLLIWATTTSETSYNHPWREPASRWLAARSDVSEAGHEGKTLGN